MPKASMSGILATAIVGAKNNSAYLADFAETICLYHKRVDEWQTAFRGGGGCRALNFVNFVGFVVIAKTSDLF